MSYKYSDKVTIDELTGRLLAWLSRNNPSSADSIAGHVLNASTESSDRVRRCLRRLEKEGMVESVDPWEQPRRWRIPRTTKFPSGKTFQAPAITAKIPKAA